MNLTKGQRIKVRGEDFLITKIKTNACKTHSIDALGIDGLVKGKTFIFNTAIDSNICPVNPRELTLKRDTSLNCIETKIYVETLIKQSPVTSEKIAVANSTAIDLNDYQFIPTLKALKLPRPRLLIADAVGLGKTVEVGIFLSEMIKRGRGKRIMILALKSVLTQFQQEIWSRFAIPLVRLDSIGIDRIRSELPTYRNPFNYYDKTIISIDTLKQNQKFYHHIEKSRWDIIVIDECHTIANSSSQRGKLALTLSNRCESLILTSATPHNGRKENFANVIRMIDPTAITWNGDYSKGDIQDYVIRRFKKDVESRSNFKDRKVIPLYTELNSEEEDFLELQQEIKRKGRALNVEKNNNRDLLFSIGIFKSFLSSPKAALDTIAKRIKKVEGLSKISSLLLRDDIAILKDCHNKLKELIQPYKDSDSKYINFRSELKKLGWSGRKKDDRYVLFTERIGTLEYLKERLSKDFNLKSKSIICFHGNLTDLEQQEIVDDFGSADSDIRMMLCTDAGSLGVNLHYYCNHIFNYDIPWSLITLEQRNGRIDRYGQKKTPHIYYLLSKSTNQSIETDLKIIDVLRKKEEEVYHALGDAGSVMELYDPIKEEKKVEKALEIGDEEYLNSSKQSNKNFFEELFEESNKHIVNLKPDFENKTTIFNSEGQFYLSLCNYVKKNRLLPLGHIDFTKEENQIDSLEVLFSKEIKGVMHDIPAEAKPKDNHILYLTLDKKVVDRAITDARKKKKEWPRFQIIHENHPLIQYFLTTIEANISNNIANVVKLNQLPKGEIFYIINGQVANSSGAIELSDFFVVRLRHPRNLSLISFEKFVRKFSLKETLYSSKIEDLEMDSLKEHLDEVINESLNHMKVKQSKRESELINKFIPYESKLEKWKKDSIEGVKFHFRESESDKLSEWKKEDHLKKINSVANITEELFNKLIYLDGEPYIRIISIFYNS